VSQSRFWPLVLLGLACSCKSNPERAAPVATVSAAAASASAVANAAPAPSVSASAAEPAATAENLPLSQTPLRKVVLDADGQLVAELDRTPVMRAVLTLSTREAPLAPRARAAHARIAELVAPGVVAPTALRSLPTDELAKVAGDKARAAIRKHARVLANGTIEVALSLAPSPALVRVDLVSPAPEAPASAWETALGAKDAVPSELAPTLAQYQSLLAADYVAGNLVRRAVHLHEKLGRITAVEDNEAFSPEPKEGTLKDDLGRLSRHMTYSKSLRDRLAAIDRSKLDEALRWGKPSTLLVTPRQVDEAVDRIRSIQRLIDLRIKQRGEDRGLALP